MQRDVLQERFFNALISGHRADARAVIGELVETDCDAERIVTQLLWPMLEKIQQMRRADQLTNLAYHYATRLLRLLSDQMQLRLEQKPSRDRSVLVVTGTDESEELAAQMVTDLLEADGYTVWHLGGGIANDEIVEEIGNLRVDVLCVFGATADTVPMTRLLIDRLHELACAPQLQVVIGGGVFNRADGLAEEIGADLWAYEPYEIVEAIGDEPERRMTADQRTVGRKRRKPARSKKSKSRSAA